MTTVGSSHVLPFDPDRGEVPAELEAMARDVADRGAPLLLAVSENARVDRWAARAAVALAELISRHGRRVVLADLGFADPVLHDLLELPNGEGIGDVLLFGASPEHVALPAPARGFDLIPAGAFVPEPEEVLGHKGWARLFAQLGHAGKLLVAYLPADGDALAMLSRVIGDVVILAHEAETGDLRAAAGEPARVHVALTPAAPALPLLTLAPVPETAQAEPVPSEAAASDATTVEPPASEPAAAELTTAEPVAVEPPVRTVTQPASPSDQEARDALERVRVPRDEEREAMIADLRARQRAALARPAGAIERGVAHPSPIVGMPVESHPPEITEPPVAPARAEVIPRRRTSRLLITLVIVLLLSALAGLWHFGRSYLRARNVPAEEQGAPAAAPVEPPVAAEPAGEPLPYSVAIEAHQDLPTAVRRVESLTGAEPALGFYIAPILVDNALYYRVMAGPVRDSATAASVMQSLRTKGHKSGGSDWDIRATPYAFLLGRYELREQAEERMQQLRQLEVPSYVIEIPYTAGPARYHLYSGAYSGSAEAEVMRQMLRSAGLPDTLVERTGRSPHEAS